MITIHRGTKTRGNTSVVFVFSVSPWFVANRD